MKTLTLGTLIYRFLLDYLPQQKGLRENTIRSYRDMLRLLLIDVATETKHGVSDLQLEQITFEHVLAFVCNLEATRHNAISTRNQRLGALHTFFEYVGRQRPEMLHVCEKVAAIPIKRVPLPETSFLSRGEIQQLFAQLPKQGRFALRDRTLLLFLYNTGARVQEASDLRLEHLSLTKPASVRLCGKGGKSRSCPLWDETTSLLSQLLGQHHNHDPQTPVFISTKGNALTRFGIYKRVRKHAACLESNTATPQSRRISPHIFRHSTAVHLLEAGVEVNVIRGWLGHVSLDTTNRYAEITARMKEEALKLCEPPVGASVRSSTPSWHNDNDLLTWLGSL